MVTTIRDLNIERPFPQAFDNGYRPTSNYDYTYNCIAWAAGVTNMTWWPIPLPTPGVYWPPGAPPQETVSAFVQAFATLGYEDCGMDGSLADGYEKIAIYANAQGTPTHAARQLLNGEWTSKLGKYKDIHHSTPAALESSPRATTAYGTVARYLRRERRPGYVPLTMPGVPDSAP